MHRVSQAFTCASGTNKRAQVRDRNFWFMSYGPSQLHYPSGLPLVFIFNHTYGKNLMYTIPTYSKYKQTGPKRFMRDVCIYELPKGFR